MVILLSSDLKQVATGYCPNDNIRKFFGGKIEQSDGEYNSCEEEVAMNCALRELMAEAGVPRTDIFFITKLHVRRWGKYNPSTKIRVPCFQYFFLASAKAGISLPSRVAEEEEMTDRKFVDIPMVLASWNLSFGDKDRINPTHAIGLMRCLHFLEERFSGDRRFESFFQMLAHLDHSGIHRSSYITEIEDALLRGHLQRRGK